MLSAHLGRLDRGTAVLIELLRSRYTPLDEGRLIAALDTCSVDDWRYAVEFHGVGGLLAAFYAPALETHLDAEKRAELDRLVRAQKFETLQQAGFLKSLLDRFERAAIPVVPIKGLPLSARLYTDISLRVAGDIDLLVDPGSVEQAFAVLHNLGWTKLTDYELTDEAVARRAFTYLHHRVFVREDGPRVELHWRSASSPFLAIPPLHTLDGDLAVTQCDGLRFRMLPDEWQTHLVLCHSVHARMGRLKWAIDVIDLLAAAPGCASTPQARRSLAISHAMLAEQLRLPGGRAGALSPLTRAVFRAAHRLEERRLVGRDSGGISALEKIAEALVRQAAHVLQHPPAQRFGYLRHLIGLRLSVVYFDEPVPSAHRLGALGHTLAKLFGLRTAGSRP